MDDYQLNRLEAFSSYVKLDSKGLEIGPSYRPTFPKAAGYDIKIIDHCSTEELIAKYRADSYVPQDLVDQIENVDIVWNEGSYRNLPSICDDLDYIVASHVIEHTTDVFGFLKDCSDLLKVGGCLLLVIPDKRCVLDCCRPSSTIGDVLIAHLAPGVYDIKSELDESWYGALLDSGAAWSMDHLEQATNDGRIAQPQREVAVGGAIWKRSVSLSLSGNNASVKNYRDAHRWVFDPANFKDIVSFLEHYAPTNLQLEFMPAPFGCEFYAVLRKVPDSSYASKNTLESARLQSMHTRIGSLDQSRRPSNQHRGVASLLATTNPIEQHTDVLPANNLNSLLVHEDGRFIECAYLTLLNRPSDPQGHKAYLSQLRNGTPKIKILESILSSYEAKNVKSELEGLSEAVARHRKSRLPLIGGFFK
jgi:Domain of unknown function (DUF4214)